MAFVEVFFVAFLVSFVGSIPPGTINVSVMQLSMQHQRKAAIFLAMSATLVEFLYAALAVNFQQFLSAREQLNFYLMIVTGAVLVVMGVFNLFSEVKSARFMETGQVRRRVGFMRGFILGTLNPLTIPFWLAVTAYLETHGWVELSGHNFWFYIIGLSLGTFILLVLVDLLGSQFQRIADNVFLVHRIPGILLTGMGLYNFWVTLF